MLKRIPKVAASLLGRRSKGKMKGIWPRERARGSFPPSLLARPSRFSHDQNPLSLPFRTPATQPSSSDILLFFDSLISRTPIAFPYGVSLRKSFAWTHSYAATVIASVLATETYVTHLNEHTEKLNKAGDGDTENAE